MDDKLTRQYDYKANSNLVLPTDTSLIDKRPSNEATGEVQSLVGRLSGKMGDRVAAKKAFKLQKHQEDERRRLRRERKRREKNEPSRLKQVLTTGPRGFSVAEIETKDLLYQPKSDQTTAVYGLIIKFVRKQLGFQHNSIINGAADEVIETMKNSKLNEESRRFEIDRLLSADGSLEDDDYNELCNLCKRINDWDSNQPKIKEDTAEEESGGIGVILSDDDDDASSDEYLSEVRDSDDEFDLDEMFEKAEGEALQLKDATMLGDIDTRDNLSRLKSLHINPREIDAHWLQRNLRTREIYDGSDSEALQKKEEILQILEQATDDRDLENRLIKAIDKSHFDFIKLLKQNRKTILFCTKLARATGRERDNIRSHMMHDSELSKILAVLEGAKSDKELMVSGELTAFAPMDMQEETMDSKYKSLNLDEFSKRQTNIAPKIDIGEPIRKAGYQEYHIAPRKRQSYRHEMLIKIEDLPENERKAFGDLKSLNLIQSRIYKKVTTTDKSLLICAPTGAGKTNIAILAMLREILKYPKRDGIGFDTEKFKIIYIAPIKALVQEIVENFTKRLGSSPYNLKVDELTGDHQLDQRQISRSQIIVCTPEKWDIVTRKSLDRLYTKLVKLVIFDEIHLLHNERGATLEALVARVKRHKSIEGEPIRIVGLSATLPNYEDVSRFIAPEDSLDDSTFYFDSTYRPIPLKQQYIAMTETKKAFRMINEIVYEKVIERLAEQAQILIFVHSRPDTAKTADFIRCKALDDQKLGLFLSSESARDKINEDGRSLGSKLKELLQFGIGIHHAGLSKSERSCVEELFRGKFIKVLVSTATLAWGVNLPARTVIIKGTQVYREGRWTDLDSLDVTQMLGRAGRPGYDREGEGIVITQQSQVNFYMSLMTEQLPVESKLIGRLPEFINAECVIGNIESLEDAVSWLSETYLSSRMTSILHQIDNKQYMSMYGIDSDAKKNDPKLVFHKHNLAYTASCVLDERGLIVFDRSSGAIRSTELGRIASHYNCSSRTIKLFYDSIHEHTSDIELFRTFSLADEFKDIYLRRGEEADLQTLFNQVPFPIDDKRATPGANKVNALLQVYIFRMNIEGSDLICDMHFIKESASRLARAIHEIVLMKSYALVAELSFDLCRKIDKRMTVCHSPLRQFSEDLDADMVNRLEKKNYHIDELRILKADKLSELLRCDRHQGEKIYRFLKYLPKLKIEASVKPVTKSSLKIDLSMQPDFSWNDRYHGSSEKFWVLVEDVNQEVLLHHEMIYIRKYNLLDKIRTSFYVTYLTPVHPFYFIRILPDNWFGCDHHLPIYLEKLCLPDEAAIITQPLDLEPQSARSLENPLFERYYEERFRGAYFNQIQTQSFKHIYLSDDDFILLASAGSGKTVCAELSIMRSINKRGTVSKCAYIGANSQAAQIVYDSWSKTFGRHYGVILLTGNHRNDAAKVDLESTNIVIGNFEDWHVLTLTRSRKYRKLLNKFQLFVIDDIHLLHNDKNSALEWLCSKIRILTKVSAGDHARLVVLGSPIACAESLKNWLAFERGTREPILLNYPPSIRPVKIDLTVQKFHHYDYRMRLMTMLRPTYRYITNCSRNKPALIFVADGFQAQETCTTLLSYARADNYHLIKPMGHLEGLKNSRLRECLAQGIGYLHLGMDREDRTSVEKLFATEQIVVLVCTVASCWSLQCRSYLTVVMDTQQYNGVEATDYELTDVMQMIGLTGRSLADHECKSIVMCHSSKAEYYEQFLREPLPLESNLPANLIAHVGYEIATGAITELNNVYKPYLAHTFFYKRISVNPNYYGIVVPADPDQKSKVYGSFFNDLVNKVSLDLERAEFMTMEGSLENPKFIAGLLSKISLEYYINYETLVNFTKWLMASSKPYELRPLELIELISTNTIEFKTIPVRHGELRALKALQRRHRPRDGDQLSHRSFKIKLLILSFYQKVDGNAESLEGELVEERSYVITMCYRLLMAIVDLAWLKDSFSLAMTAIKLAKKLAPFTRSTQPNIEMDTSIVKDNNDVRLDITISREDNHFNLEEFRRNFTCPDSMYREEGWCFLIHGQPRSRDDPEKFLLFKRIKTPAKGVNEYKLEFTLPDNASVYDYDLYLMSDFYSTKEDRKVPNISIKSPSE